MWLADAVYHLLREPARLGTGLDVVRLTELTHPNCRAELYAAFGLSPSIENWSRIYYNEPSPEFLRRLEEYFSDAFVIGFELPYCLRRGLADLGIPYINLVIYPIRFHSDLMFGFSTNSLHLEAVFREERVPEAAFLCSAAQQRARYAPNIYDAQIQGRVLMLIGQYALDKALISRQGGFHSLMDFAKQIAELASGYDQTIFCPHPLRESPHESEALRQAVPSLILRPSSFFPELNIYALLSHPGVAAFAGLNSSVLFEASYFEKKSTAFIEYETDFGDIANGVSREQCWAVQSCFQPAFWRRCIIALTGKGPVTSFPLLPIPSLRLTLRGLGGFDDAQSYTQCLKIASLEKRCLALEKNEEMINEIH
jgi:hypothetical protein